MRKKDNFWRICIDYIGLNAKIINNSFATNFDKVTIYRPIGLTYLFPFYIDLMLDVNTCIIHYKILITITLTLFRQETIEENLMIRNFGSGINHIHTTLECYHLNVFVCLFCCCFCCCYCFLGFIFAIFDILLNC